jgi:predicted nicotinamide N-methyase
VRLTRVASLHGAIDIDEQLRAPSPPEPPYWMHLWPGAVALARRIASSSLIVPGVHVVELGSGLALPAVTAAVCGARVVATDRVWGPLQIARQSAAQNGATLSTLRMDWAAPALRERFDVCLGADIGYDLDGAATLASTLAALVRPGGRVWLADSVNIHRTDLPAALQRVGFVVHCAETREEEEGRPVWVRIVEGQFAS